MDLKILREAMRELQEQQIRIDETLQALGRVISMFEKDEPKPPFANARVVEHPKAPTRIAFSEPESPRAPCPQESSQATAAAPPAEPVFQPDATMLRAWRKERGLNQTQAGKRLGVPMWKVSYIERGQSAITPEMLERMNQEEDPGRQPGSRFPAIS